MTDAAKRVRVSLRNVREAAAANIENELKTRRRVELLEAFAGAIDARFDDLDTRVDATIHVVGQHMDFLQMGFWDRLRWLMTGYLPERKAPGAPVDLRVRPWPSFVFHVPGRFFSLWRKYGLKVAWLTTQFAVTSRWLVTRSKSDDTSAPVTKL